jgi:hypothetical protein
MAAAKREKLPHKRRGLRADIGDLHLCAGEYEDGTLGEVFLTMPKEGTFSKDILSAFAMSVSIGLQHGVPLDAYAHAFREFSMEPDYVRGVFRLLEERYGPGSNGGAAPEEKKNSPRLERGV